MQSGSNELTGVSTVRNPRARKRGDAPKERLLTGARDVGLLTGVPATADPPEIGAKLWKSNSEDFGVPRQTPE
eukprot:9021049-Alexandrium_andersonii.AAC.1